MIPDVIADPCRYRLRLVQVGLLGNVSAALVQLDGAAPGQTWEASSHEPLTEFLARGNYEIPAGTPLIRLGLLDEGRVADFLAGPHWDAHLPTRHIRPPYGYTRPYAGEIWAQLRRYAVAPDVYAQLAPSAEVVVEQLAGNGAEPAPPTAPAGG